MKIKRKKFLLSILFITVIFMSVSFLGIKNARAVEDDEFGENDDFASAAELFPNRYNDLVNWDDDYFKINRKNNNRMR